MWNTYSFAIKSWYKNFTHEMTKLKVHEAAVNLTKSGELRPEGASQDSLPFPAKQGQVKQVQLPFYLFRQFFISRFTKSLTFFSTHHFSLLPFWRLKSSSGKT